MAKISQVRGALFEEAILFLLKKVGYETIENAPPNIAPDKTGLRNGSSGLDVRGRGTWHQIDALASYLQSPPFMYPLRLIVEAKCYDPNRPVGVEVVRNIVGVLKDVSENYFSENGGEISGIQVSRHNYQAAIFSTSGYTKGAVEYAIAHQIFLIQHKNVPVIQPLIDRIMSFDEECITEAGKKSVSQIRRIFRKALKQRLDFSEEIQKFLTLSGYNMFVDGLTPGINRIGGSYFGMLQGRWPMHFLTEKQLPPNAFESDTITCQIQGYDSGQWSFTPSNINQDSNNWFELQFNLPPAIAELVKSNWGDHLVVANIKQEHFSFVNLSGKIGGINRSVRLELDPNWINRYIEKLKK